MANTPSSINSSTQDQQQGIEQTFNSEQLKQIMVAISPEITNMIRQQLSKSLEEKLAQHQSMIEQASADVQQQVKSLLYPHLAPSNQSQQAVTEQKSQPQAQQQITDSIEALVAEKCKVIMQDFDRKIAAHKQLATFEIDIKSIAQEQLITQDFDKKLVKKDQSFSTSLNEVKAEQQLMFQRLQLQLTELQTRLESATTASAHFIDKQTVSRSDI